jgi:hypothetical protein
MLRAIIVSGINKITRKGITGAARKSSTFLTLKRSFELITSARIPAVNVRVATRRPGWF